MGVALGLSNTPKKRLIKFYEKHNPSKVEDVGMLIRKYSSDYKPMIKKLEAKYHDYGFFLQWEKDSDISAVQAETYKYVVTHATKYYQRYMPWQIRQGLRNIHTNVNFYWKKLYKILDKQLTPKNGNKKQRKKSSSRRTSKR